MEDSIEDGVMVEEDSGDMIVGGGFPEEGSGDMMGGFFPNEDSGDGGP